MTRSPVLVSMIAVIGCGGGGGDPDAGPPGADGRPADARPDAGATSITYTVVTFDGQPEDTDIVLVSDNGGPWTPITGTGGVYQASVVGPRYAIARGCRDADILYDEAWIYYLTLDDTTDIHDVGCQYSLDPQGYLYGAITGAAADQRATIVTRYATTNLVAGATDYAVVMPPETTDMVARLYADVPTTQPRPTQRLLIRRDVDVTADTLVDLDFATDGIDPDTHTFVVTGAGTGQFDRISVSLRDGGLYTKPLESTRTTSADYHTIPSAMMRPGEKLELVHTTNDGLASRSVQLTLAAPADVTAALAPPYPTAEPTVIAQAPGPRLAGTLPHVDGADLYFAYATTEDDTTFELVGWQQIYTARYAGDQAIDYVYPDLAGIGGWDVALLPGPVGWTHGVRTSTAKTLVPGFPDSPAVDGDIQTESKSLNTITP